MSAIFSRIDWTLFGTIAVLMLLGVLSLLSTAPDLFVKQIIWICIGAVVMVGMLVVDMRSFLGHKGFMVALYVGIILLLLATYFFAPEIKGNRAWLVIGGFQFQPSELAKIVLIIVLAHFFSKRYIGIARWSTMFTSFAYMAVPVALIAIQPDLGSALILVAIWLGFVLLSGLPLRTIMLFVLFGIVVFALMWTLVLADYQKARIMGVFEPEQDPLGINYSVIQSKIAIGSGGLLGKGFGQGTQIQLGFLPEAQTDFIFSAIAEEGGFVAVLLLVTTFMWMILRILKIGSLAEGNTLKFLCLGVAVMFLTQFVLNIGSAIGMLPVVGITLPFVSYGGSSLLANMVLIGMIQSLQKRG